MKMVMEKSSNFDISHGILPILPLNCTKYEMFFATTKKLSINVESLHFLTFFSKRRNANAKM